MACHSFVVGTPYRDPLFGSHLNIVVVRVEQAQWRQRQIREHRNIMNLLWSTLGSTRRVGSPPSSSSSLSPPPTTTANRVPDGSIRYNRSLVLTADQSHTLSSDDAILGYVDASPLPHERKTRRRNVGIWLYGMRIQSSEQLRSTATAEIQHWFTHDHCAQDEGFTPYRGRHLLQAINGVLRRLDRQTCVVHPVTRAPNPARCSWAPMGPRVHVPRSHRSALFDIIGGVLDSMIHDQGVRGGPAGADGVCDTLTSLYAHICVAYPHLKAEGGGAPFTGITASALDHVVVKRCSAMQRHVVKRPCRQLVVTSVGARRQWKSSVRRFLFVVERSVNLGVFPLVGVGSCDSRRLLQVMAAAAHPRRGGKYIHSHRNRVASESDEGEEEDNERDAMTITAAAPLPPTVSSSPFLVDSLTPDQVRAVCKTMQPGIETALFLTALHTGMRIGGMRRIKTASVATTRPQPATTGTGAWVVFPMGVTIEKMERTHRFILTDAMRRSIGAYLSTKPYPTRYLFASGPNNKSGIPRLRRILRNLLFRAGVPEHICHPHAIRKTTASTLIDAGVNVHTVSRLLGHSSTSQTFRN
jgi:hypothetical protein